MANPAGPRQSQKAGVPFLVTWLKENVMADPAGPMQFWKTVLLFVYLVIAGFVTMYCVYGLWAAEPKAAQWRPAEPSSPPVERPADGRPQISRIDPQAVTIGTDQASIQVFGSNFTENSRVTFDDVDRATQYVNGDQLVVRVNNGNFAAPGAVVVKVVDGEKSSNAMILMVEAAGNLSGDWHLFGRRIQIRHEPRLILLVLFTGAFGACMAGLPSLADYLGERKLVESWFTFYLARPFAGGGIAFIFYLVIRGGFLAGTNADPAAVNPFGLTAVAALVGMFSDKAILKLREVFSTLFKADDTRSDKLGQLTITTGPKLPDAQVGVAYTQILTASGGTPPYTWAAVTPLPDWLRLDAPTGRLTGTPPAAAAETSYTVQVTDKTGAAVTAELTLTIGPLSMASPPDAPIGSPS
jgi:Putative Ig domain/IPT/TIG domain